ncbi:chromophore lyase CpcT/CpeT [Prochlorococcus sp. MIT 1300]|uniref:chromophore lyase CpcT/CpeT n=1 Tax=Prochlorococcus sp. MIT 1300 TaxID=3096218 RepID=UPI002A74BBAE|nr:chromophore lyase CpcT/CpeT [Prochlorococcus sp. MIT 1300]
METQAILRFAKTISGHYNNKEQAQNDPVHFANINIFFRPLAWDIFRGPAFYSEQSYDYAPWSPYRQALHKLTIKNEKFILNNYKIKHPLRLAGSGFKPDLLKELKHCTYEERRGCSMHFIETKFGNYKGSVEPGNSCLIYREGKETFLESIVEFNEDIWISHDRGLCKETNQQIWGSRFGALSFTRVKNLGENLEESWVYSK